MHAISVRAVFIFPYVCCDTIKVKNQVAPAPVLEMISSIWIKFVPERGAFGIQATTFFQEEKVFYADDVDFLFIFPARPRPGIANMNISTDGVKIKVRQPLQKIIPLPMQQYEVLIVSALCPWPSTDVAYEADPKREPKKLKI